MGMVCFYAVVVSNNGGSSSSFLEGSSSTILYLRGATGRRLSSSKLIQAQQIILGCLQEHYDDDPKTADNLPVPQVFACMNKGFRTKLKVDGKTWDPSTVAQTIGVFMNESKNKKYNRLSKEELMVFIQGAFVSVIGSKTIDELFYNLDTYFKEVHKLRDTEKDAFLAALAFALPDNILG